MDKMDNKLNIKILLVCRTCLKETIHTSFFHLDSTQATTEPTFRQKLCKCIPELDLSVLPDAVICDTCAKIINTVYEFKNECLQSEIKIHKYIHQVQHTDVINLAQVTQFYQLHCEENLALEIKTEDLEIKTEVLDIKAEDIEIKEDLKTEELAISNYDANTFNDLSKITEPTKEHSFQNEIFNTDKSYPTCSTFTMEENLDDNTNKNSLKNHMCSQTEEKLFKCPVCEQQFTQKNNLKTHMAIHTGEKSFSCSICEYRSNSKYNLKIHIFGHTGERPFNCSVCDYKARNKSNLRQHVQIHKEQKQFSCSFCEYRSNDRSTLKRHTRFHTGELFTCSICEYRSNTKHNLKSHMLSHTGNKPFKCSVCDYRSSYKSHLKRHIQIHTTVRKY